VKSGFVRALESYVSAKGADDCALARRGWEPWMGRPGGTTAPCPAARTGVLAVSISSKYLKLPGPTLEFECPSIININ
jgi:hypothetical protein